jgi:hypothetical protein
MLDHREDVSLYRSQSFQKKLSQKVAVKLHDKLRAPDPSQTSHCIQMAPLQFLALSQSALAQAGCERSSRAGDDGI